MHYYIYIYLYIKLYIYQKFKFTYFYPIIRWTKKSQLVIQFVACLFSLIQLIIVYKLCINTWSLKMWKLIWYIIYQVSYKSYIYIFIYIYIYIYIYMLYVIYICIYMYIYNQLTAQDTSGNLNAIWELTNKNKFQNTELDCSYTENLLKQSQGPSLSTIPLLCTPLLLILALTFVATYLLWSIS